MIAEEAQRHRSAEAREFIEQAGQHRVAVGEQPEIGRDQVGLLALLGRPGAVVLDRHGIDEGGPRAVLRQREDPVGHRRIGDIAPLPGCGRREGFLADQRPKPARRHDPVAAVEAHVVGMDETAVPRAMVEPVRQCPARLAHGGEEGVEAAHSQPLLRQAEQHAVFGPHRVGAEARDREAAGLPRQRTCAFEPGQGERRIAEQVDRVGEALALDDHHQLARFSRDRGRSTGRQIGRGAPGAPMREQAGHKAEPRDIRLGIGHLGKPRPDEPRQRQREGRAGAEHKPRARQPRGQSGVGEQYQRHPQPAEPPRQHHHLPQPERREVELGVLEHRAEQGEIAEHQRLAEHPALDVGDQGQCPCQDRNSRRRHEGRAGKGQQQAESAQRRHQQHRQPARTARAGRAGAARRREGIGQQRQQSQQRECDHHVRQQPAHYPASSAGKTARLRQGTAVRPDLPLFIQSAKVDLYPKSKQNVVRASTSPQPRD